MPSKTIWTPLFVQLMIFEVLCQFAMALVNPIVSNYAVVLGASFSVAGFLAGLNALSSLVFRPFGGLALARGGRKQLLLVSTAVFAVSSFVCIAAESVSFLGLSRVVLGAAFVIKSSLVVAFAAAVVPRDCIGQSVGWIGLAYTVANAVGPGIGSWIGLAFGYRSTFLVSGIMFALALATLAFLKDPQSDSAAPRSACGKPDAEEGLAEGRRRGLSALLHFPTVPLAVITMCEAFLYGSIINLVLLVSEQRGIENASTFFFVYAVVTMLARPHSSKLYDRYGLSKVLYPEAALMALAPVALAFAHSLPMLLFAGVLLALGQGCLYPSLQAESVKGVDERDSSISVNTFYMGPDVGMAAGPLVSGAVLQALGPTAMYLTSCAAALLFIAGYRAYEAWRGRLASSGVDEAALGDTAQAR